MRGPTIITDAQRIFDAGMNEGIIQHQIECATKMISDNVPDENIIKYTGIPHEKLEELKTRIAKEILKYQISCATKMLYDELPDEKIIKYSGISPELLEELKAKIDES